MSEYIGRRNQAEERVIEINNENELIGAELWPDIWFIDENKCKGDYDNLLHPNLLHPNLLPPPVRTHDLYDFFDDNNIIILVKDKNGLDQFENPAFGPNPYHRRLVELYNKGVAKKLRSGDNYFDWAGFHHILEDHFPRDIARMISDYTPLSPKYVLALSFDRFEIVPSLMDGKGEILFDEENILTSIDYDMFLKNIPKS